MKNESCKDDITRAKVRAPVGDETRSYSSMLASKSCDRYSTLSGSALLSQRIPRVTLRPHSRPTLTRGFCYVSPSGCFPLCCSNPAMIRNAALPVIHVNDKIARWQFSRQSRRLDCADQPRCRRMQVAAKQSRRYSSYPQVRGLLRQTVRTADPTGCSPCASGGNSE